MGCCGLSFGPWNEQADRLPSQSWWRQQPTSGNRTFDEYRIETLRRLEQEQRDFQDFLARLRMAKAKAAAARSRRRQCEPLSRRGARRPTRFGISDCLPCQPARLGHCDELIPTGGLR